MAVASFNSNVLALRIQRSLASATEAVGSSYERLSTGMRINRAADDAAGLAIADSLRVDSRLYSAAVRNINDGISALNIINGALDSQSGILQRMAELAEQAANGTLSSSQRGTLNQEYYSLTQEFGRIGESTSFNGLNLLLAGRKNNPRELFLQAGIRGGIDNFISVTSGDTGRISGVLDRDSMVTSAITSGSAQEIVDAFNNNVIRTRVTDSLGNSHEVLLAVYDTGVSQTSMRVEMYMKRDETAVGGSTDDYVRLGNAAIPNINYDPVTGNVTSQSGNFINIAGGANIIFSRIDLSGLKISSSSGVSGINLGKSTAIDASGVESIASAKASLDLVMRRLESLSLLRGSIGASQSRLNVALDLNASARESTSAAESRIRDVDVASESAELVAQQIRQQSATSVLQRANSQPGILLALLKNV